MSETAQIILALGASLALVLAALQGNLAVILNRNRSLEKRTPQDRSLLRQRWLLAVVTVSALSGLLNLLSRLV
jgi:hypothetical protein